MIGKGLTTIDISSYQKPCNLVLKTRLLVDNSVDNFAYSLYMGCIIGIGYRICYGYREKLWKWAISMRERILLRIDMMLSSKTALHQGGVGGGGWISGGLVFHRPREEKNGYKYGHLRTGSVRNTDFEIMAKNGEKWQKYKTPKTKTLI